LAAFPPGTEAAFFVVATDELALPLADAVLVVRADGARGTAAAFERDESD